MLVVFVTISKTARHISPIQIVLVVTTIVTNLHVVRIGASHCTCRDLEKILELSYAWAIVGTYINTGT